ncbi:hypothetical protein ACOMHN_046789 [Nucella lapillus]
MFQSVRQFQGRTVKANNAASSATTKSFRDHLKVAGLVTVSGASARTTPMYSETEPPSCWALTKEHLRRELWSYLALLGLLSIYFGILVCVYALKGVFAQRGVMTFCGIFLNGLGGMKLFFSWMCYRCQRKHRKFSLCCGDDHEAAPPSHKPPKSRPRGQSLAGFLTPEFAKYAEFSARDRRYENKRPNFFKAYDPAQISISFAHK